MSIDFSVACRNASNGSICITMTTDETFELTVAVCIEDVQLRRQVTKAIQSLGYVILQIESGAEILRRRTQRSILITDESWFSKASVDSMAFAMEFRTRRVMLHIVRRGNVDGALKAVRAGACNVLERPVDDSVLINNIRTAADMEAEFSGRQRMPSQNPMELDSLDQTETAIFDGLIEGKTNKEIARKLGIGLRSVEYVRAQIMVKLNVTTLAQLVAIVTSEQVRVAIEPLREFDSLLSRHLS